ncbi:MAG: DUF1566 domain-containing protein [Candidatus Gracilibacteria bacterium]|nr:DUF1566 domain-containing protein [Candidatus Gracilibacteria bacterium]
MALLEEPSDDVVAIFKAPDKGMGFLNKTNAIDYTDRYPKTTGKKLGILTDENNTPIQEIESGDIDLTTTSLKLKSYLKGEEYIEGSGAILITELVKLSDIDEVGGKYWRVEDNKFLYKGEMSCADGSISQYLCADTDSTRFTDLGTGVIKDNLTLLEWQKDGSTDGTKTWTNAKAYCANLTLGGKTDWRLPDVTELLSIVDFNKYNPSIDSKFTNTASSYYWSSTTSKNSTSTAWHVGFYIGDSVYSFKTTNLYVRCTR